MSKMKHPAIRRYMEGNKKHLATATAPAEWARLGRREPTKQDFERARLERLRARGVPCCVCGSTEPGCEH